MTDTASAAPSERERFERHVKAYTGRDIEYHERNGTTGLEFGWACWQAARAHPTPLAAVEPPRAFTPRQRERLFYNRPSNVGKGLSMADWHRTVQYLETTHGIGIKGGQHG